MVYFTCGACGEQVKKPQVEKHYTQKCRNCNILTCIDCLKDFYGEEYKTHNQCMSEAQRYSKEGRGGWDPTKGQGNKGDKKQQEWMEKLRGLLDSNSGLDLAVRNIVNTIADHDNIPRKRPKFINFVKNIMRNKAAMHDIEKTWDLFSQALQPAQQPSIQNTEDLKAHPEVAGSAPMDTDQQITDDQKSKKEKKRSKNKGEEVSGARDDNKENGVKVEQENGLTKKKEKKKKKNKDKENLSIEPVPTNQEEEKRRKRKHEEISGNVGEDNLELVNKKAKFDWDGTIEALLTKKGNKMKLKKLKKKCVSEYFVQNSNAHQTPEQIGVKFDKKIKKRQKYKIVGEEVILSNNVEAFSPPAPTCPDVRDEANTHSNTVGAQPDEKEKNTLNGNGMSFNAWEAASLGSDAQTDKFRRLMGIKTNAKPQQFGVKKRNDGKIFRDLEQGFEKARDTHFRGKGLGLGYSQ